MIRLAYMDAPELGQRSRWGIPVGQQSARFLREMALRRRLKIALLHRGVYGRWIGRVFLLREGEEVDINLEMVLQGHAFAASFRRKPPGIFLWAQSLAKAKGRGLWYYRGVQRPWYYRRKQKKAPSVKGRGN